MKKVFITSRTGLWWLLFSINYEVAYKQSHISTFYVNKQSQFHSEIKTLVNVANVNNLFIVFVLFCLMFYVPAPVFKENYNFLRLQGGRTFSKG